MHNRSLVLIGLAVAAIASLRAATPDKTTVLVEGEDFQFTGNWMVASDTGCSGKKLLQTAGSPADALTLIDLPAAGTYHIWTRSRDFLTDTGKRRYLVVIDGEPVKEESGHHGVEGWKWEKVGIRQLSAGDHVLGLRDTAKFFGRCDAILLTTGDEDPNQAKLAKLTQQRITPKTIPIAATTRSLQRPEPKKNAARKEAGQIGNEHCRVRFWETESKEGTPLIVRETELQINGSWVKVPIADEETLFMLYAAEPQIVTSNYFPYWPHGAALRFEIAGRAYESSGGANPFLAGRASALVPASCRQLDAATVELTHPSKQGPPILSRWSLQPGRHEVGVEVSFEAPADGAYSVGFSAFQPWSEKQIEFNLLSPLYQFQRRPLKPTLLVSANTPHPLAMVQAAPAGKETYSFSVLADPKRIPYEWAKPDNSRYGFSLLNAEGIVQPTIFSPVLGMKDSMLKKGEVKSVSWMLLIEPGDWKRSLAYASDEIFKVADYRQPHEASLTEAALNLIDLIKNDEFGGWNSRMKGFYNIESLDTVTQASPLTVLSAAVLTEDERLYQERALPTLAYVLSRPAAHFSYKVPQSHPVYVTKDSLQLTVPSKFFGATFWEGAHSLLGQKNPWLAEMALNAGNVRYSTSYNTMPRWSELMAAYRLSPSPERLEEIKREADAWLKEQMYGRHADDLGIVPFYNIQFYPYWWDLPDLYEITGDEKYLRAAEEGAFFTMAGQWSQPSAPPGETKVHEGGNFLGEAHMWWKGDQVFRLGWPLAPGALPEKLAPAWLVSPVGLSLEQPVTYYAGGKTGFGNIFMSCWAPNLLRTYGHSGKEIYRTYARNTIIGRFSNYPGYYLRGFTDLPLGPNYPMQGPDVTSIYYHHIPPHLAFTLDYLVTDAEVRSKGAIKFPYSKQQGYVWFSNRIYGGKRGSIYGDQEMQLWLNRDAVKVSSAKISHLAARNADRFCLVLMNETNDPVTGEVILDAAQIGLNTKQGYRIVANGESRDEKAPFDGHITVPGRGLTVLSFPTAKRNEPNIPVLAARPAEQKLEGSWGTAHAFRIRSPFANDSIYIVLTGQPPEGSVAQLKIDGSTETAPLASEFPYEFIVHPWPMDRDFSFTLVLKDADGNESSSMPITLAGTRP